MKAVFDVRPESGYDDEISKRYHFPARADYLAVARRAVGDWVVFREPRRAGGREAYVATGRVESVERDPDSDQRYYARISDYLPFPTPVPFSDNGRYREAALRAKETNRIGTALQGRSMRPIEDLDFAQIALAGIDEVLDPSNAVRLGLDLDIGTATHQYAGIGFGEAQERRVEQLLVNRTFREASFRFEVCRAYENRCAVTGLKIINGGGRAEVQAAHIKPVASGGPDIVQNGIALSATVHWLFDRHLISIADDFSLLVSHNRVPSEIRNLFHGQMKRILLPKDPRLQPHPTFMAHHREVFAGKYH